MLSGFMGAAQSALGYCGWYNSQLLTAAKNGDVAEVARLLELGANPNYKPYVGGKFPLFAAAQAGHLAIVQQLLAANADINLTYSGETALVAAARANRVDVVTYLINQNAQYNTNVSGYHSPLGYAICSNYTDMVTLLLDLAQTPPSADYLFQCLTLAAQSNALETFQALMTRAGTLSIAIDIQSLFTQAAQKGANNIINELLTTGHLPTGSMAFIEAATHCHNAIAKTLLDCMPTPEAKHAAINGAIAAIDLRIDQQSILSEQKNTQFDRSVDVTRASISNADRRMRLQLGLDTGVVFTDAFFRRNERDRLPLSLGFPAAASGYHYRRNVAAIERQERQLGTQISNHQYDMRQTSELIGKLGNTRAFLTTELAALDQAAVLEHASSSTPYTPFAQTTSSSSRSAPASSTARDSRKRTMRENSDFDSDSDADTNTLGKVSRLG